MVKGGENMSVVRSETKQNPGHVGAVETRKKAPSVFHTRSRLEQLRALISHKHNEVVYLPSRRGDTLKVDERFGG